MKKQQKKYNIIYKELEEGGSVWTHKKFIYDHNTEVFHFVYFGNNWEL